MNAVHNGQKDHKCDSCGKAFSQAGDTFIQFIIIKKGHKCESCGKSFSIAQYLKKHIKGVHSGK